MGQKLIKDKKSLEAIKNFLKEKNFRFPKNFDEKMFEEASKFNGGKLPGIPAIENLLKCCQYWKKYCVTEEDFERLVFEECYNMTRIQCSVISTHEDMNSYLGNACAVKVEKLPFCTTTVASASRAIVFEGAGSVERVFSPLR